MTNWFRLLACVSGFSAVVIFTFYLITLYDKAIIFTEPILWIRIPEIILGIITAPILFKMAVEASNEKTK